MRTKPVWKQSKAVLNSEIRVLNYSDPYTSTNEWMVMVSDIEVASYRTEQQARQRANQILYALVVSP